MFIIIVILCLFFFALGYAVAAMCSIAKEADEKMEEMMKRRKNEN